jgi:hypothetical protein
MPPTPIPESQQEEDTLLSFLHSALSNDRVAPINLAATARDYCVALDSLISDYKPESKLHQSAATSLKNLPVCPLTPSKLKFDTEASARGKREYALAVFILNKLHEENLTGAGISRSYWQKRTALATAEGNTATENAPALTAAGKRKNTEKRQFCE